MKSIHLVNDPEYLRDIIIKKRKENERLKRILNKAKKQCHSCDNDAINTRTKKELHEVLNILEKYKGK